MSDQTSDSDPQPIDEPLAAGANGGIWRARYPSGNQFTLAHIGYEPVSEVRLTGDSVQFDCRTEWRMIPPQYQVLVTTVGDVPMSRQMTLAWRSAQGNAESRSLVWETPF